MTEQADPSMADLFGDESDAEDNDSVDPASPPHNPTLTQTRASTPPSPLSTSATSSAATTRTRKPTQTTPPQPTQPTRTTHAGAVQCWTWSSSWQRWMRTARRWTRRLEGCGGGGQPCSGAVDVGGGCGGVAGVASGTRRWPSARKACPTRTTTATTTAPPPHSSTTKNPPAPPPTASPNPPSLPLPLSTRPVPPAPVTASGPPLSLLSSPAVPFGAAAKLHLVRLPNVIGVQANAFHADSYEEEAVAEEAEEVVGQGALLEGQKKKSKAVSLMVENVIRWREVKDDGEGGGVRRESNTRLVRWSDGTSSLLIGNECFDVVQSTADPHRNYVYLQHTAVQSSDPDDMSDSPPHNRSRTRPLLRSVGAFTGHIKFKVTGIDSDSHRKLKDVLFETHTKKARIVMDYNEINPEKLRMEEEKQAREDDKKRSRQLAREKGGGGGGGRRSGPRQWQQAGEDDELGDFLEEDDVNPSEKARRRKGDYEADVGRLKRAKEAQEDDGGDDGDDADFVEADEDEQAEDDGDLDEDEILGKTRTGPADKAAETGADSLADGEVTAAPGSRARAEDADDLVLHGASKRRRVLADEEESD